MNYGIYVYETNGLQTIVNSVNTLPWYEWAYSIVLKMNGWLWIADAAANWRLQLKVSLDGVSSWCHVVQNMLDSPFLLKSMPFSYYDKELYWSSKQDWADDRLLARMET